MLPRVVSVFAILLPAALRGQRVDTSQVPRELAVELIASSGFDGAKPRISVGRLPDESLARFVPREARVLGGATFEAGTYGSARATAILNIPYSIDSALQVVASTFESAGLKQAPLLQSTGGSSGGFVTFGPEIPNLLMYCGDASSVSASLAEAERGSMVRLSSTRTARHTVCDSSFQARMRGRMEEDEVEMPTLRPPQGVTSGGGGGGGSVDTRDSHATFHSPMTAEAMIDHFVPQLREQGWTASNRVTDGEHSVVMARKTSAKGDPLFLVLSDARYNTRDHSVLLRVSSPPRRNR